MSKSIDTLERLQHWYAEQCNGTWEHQYGVAIDTLDNPGWSVTIDLQGTNLELVSMNPFAEDRGENDWIHCKIEGGQFIGNGDPLKLKTILDLF